MIKQIFSCSLICFFISSCIGTDFISDPVSNNAARIEILTFVTAVEINNTVQYDAIYYNTLGERVESLEFEWASSDTTIATINQGGLALGKQRGQVEITAAANGISSIPYLLTVVQDPTQVATVIVTPNGGQIVAGETLQFSANALNIDGNLVSGKTFEWHSSDATIASISPDGLAVSHAPGIVEIRASTDGIESAPVILSIPGQSRSGFFINAPGTSYTVSGDVTLQENNTGSLELKFADNFVSSSGPSLDVYLSSTNSINGQSLSLGSLESTAGAQIYQVPANVSLTTYNWVVIHCVPFNVTFGFAELNR